MNFLGLDYGESKIGTAFAPGGILAVGMKILPNDGSFFKNLEGIIRDNEIECIVIGVPISMDSSQSIRTKKTLDFIQKVKQRFPSLSIETADERLSTREAKRNLKGSDSEDDAEAARIILQSFLDRKK
jgi:putative Holliday junction resolvase